MRDRVVVAFFVIALAIASTSMPVAFALPPLEDGLSFPTGTFVIPMDDKQAERILVFGFVHALLSAPNPITLFRVIEPPNVTLSTDLTTSPDVFVGGPFLILPSDSAKVAQVQGRSEFSTVTVGTLTSQHLMDNIFRVRQPTKILVVRGEPPWGRTDITLDEMKIPYDTVSHGELETTPSKIFSYSLIVLDCNGWNGFIPGQIASNLRSHVAVGNEVIFTDRAILDLDSTFSGYVTVSDLQPLDRVSLAYVYNAPKKFDSTKYGETADRLPPEFPSQYYNPLPRPNEISVFTESQGYAVSSVPGGRLNDVRILADTENFGSTRDKYAILAFYFEYGAGIVEGLAFHPQQQDRNTVGDNGYYAVHQFYGNKFVHGPPPSDFSIDATPASFTVVQGGSASYTITIRAFGIYNSSTTLGVTGLPPGSAYSFSPPAPRPPTGGIATSTLTVNVPVETTVGNYVLNVTGYPPVSTSLSPKWTIVNLNVIGRPSDFGISVSPNFLVINVTESKTAIVTVSSIASFNQNVTLNVTGLPDDVAVSFSPPAPMPSPGSTASSIMRFNVGSDAVNGTYPLIIVGSNSTLIRSTSFTLIIVKPAPPPTAPIPWLTLLLLLLMAFLGVGLGLLAFAMSSRRPKAAAIRPAPVVSAPVRVPAQRMYVVPADAQRIPCPRCGRPISIRSIYCPYCRHRRAAVAPTYIPGPAMVSRQLLPRQSFIARRAIWGFVLAMVSAVLVLLNAVELLSAGFWGAPTNWSAIFWWLGGPSGLGQSIAFLVGLIAGFTIMTGGFMMLMRRGPIGALIVFPFAVLSFIIGGGFLVGGVLGIVAGILGILRR